MKFSLLTILFVVANSLHAQLGVFGEPLVCRSLSTDTETYSFSCSGATNIQWSVQQGAVQGVDTNPTIEILWNGTGTGTVSVSYQCGGIPYSESLSVTISDPGTAGGTISGPVTNCEGKTITLDAGTSGNIVEWQESTNNGASWTIINTTSRTRDVNPTIPTWYRAKKTGIAPCGEVLTSIKTIQMANSLTSAGTLSTNKRILCFNELPGLISGTTPSGGTGTYSYYWEQSSNGINWEPAEGSPFGSSYQPPNVLPYEKTYYRRRAKSSNCNPLYTPSIDITKYVSRNDLFTINGNTNFCGSGTVNLTFDAPDYTLSGPGETPLMEWWKYSGTTWSPLATPVIIEDTLNVLTVPAVDGERFEVRLTYSCEQKQSNEKVVSIDDSSVPEGIISEPSGIFLNRAIGSVEAVVNTENIIRWESKDLGGSAWTDEGQGGNNVFSFEFNSPKDIRYIVNRGACGERASLSRTIDIEYRIFAGKIVGPDEAIGTINAGTLTLTGQATGSTVVRWERATAINGSPQQISNPTSTQQFDNLNQDTYYRALVAYRGTQEFTDWKHIRYYPAVSSPVATDNYVQETTLREPISDEAFVATADKRDRISYTDGLGRAVQSVWKGVTPAQQDLINFNQFTNYGTQERTYLPYVGTSAGYASDNLSAQAAFYTTPPKGVASSSTPYAEVVLDDSPYQRVLEQGSVGANWQLGTGHTVKSDIKLNGANEVRSWEENGTSTSTYPANELTISELTDENGHLTKAYIDKSGNTILKIVDLGGSQLKTYYLYDAFNRLSYQVPPKAVAQMESSGTYDVTTGQVAELVFAYTYDYRGRVITKKIPGGGTEEYVYDQLNRQVMSRNSNLAAANKWRFVKYDVRNRPVYSGIYTDAVNTTRQSVQDLLDAMNYDGADAYFETTDPASAYGYSNQAFPTTNVEVLTASFFDNYDFAFAALAEFQFVAELGHTFYTEPLSGMATGSMTKVLGDTTWLRSIQYYDDRYRAIQSIRDDNRGLGFQRTTSRYDFVGKVLETHALHTAEDLVFQNTYTYDHADRLLKVDQCITQNASDAGSSPACVQLLENEYNELGQLINKDLHVTQGPGGKEALQSVDYRYNIRGWLKSINTPTLDILSGVNEEDTQPDLFGMELIYHEPINGVPNN